VLPAEIGVHRAPSPVPVGCFPRIAGQGQC
jgi:hypothetical protein